MTNLEFRMTDKVHRSAPQVRAIVAIIAAALMFVTSGCRNQVAELTRQLQSDDPEVRQAAAQTLSDLGPDAAPAVEALRSTLHDPETQVRRVCCTALGKTGVVDESTLAALRECLDDTELPVQMAAAFALQRLDPADESSVPVLTKAIQMGEGGTIVAVGAMGTRAEWAVPTLITLLKDRRPGIRRLAAEALGRIGSNSEETSAALRKSLSDADDRVREQVQSALDRLSGPAS